MQPVKRSGGGLTCQFSQKASVYSGFRPESLGKREVKVVSIRQWLGGIGVENLGLVFFFF